MDGNTMFIGRVTIAREGYIGYQYEAPKVDKPFRATVEVHGNSNKTQLNLSPELSARIMAVIADEIVAAARATAEAMVADALTIQQPALAAPTAPVAD